MADRGYSANMLAALEAGKVQLCYLVKARFDSGALLATDASRDIIWPGEWSDTFATTDVDVTNDKIEITGHDLHTTDAVRVSSTDTLPAPLAADTTYYAIKVTVEDWSDTYTATDVDTATDQITITGHELHTAQSVRVSSDAKDWTDTFATTDVDTTTDEITLTGHNLDTEDPVVVSSTSTLPAPLTVDTTYYVIKVDDDTIQLAASVADAQSGTEIDLTTVGAGTHTVQTDTLAVPLDPDTTYYAIKIDANTIQLAASISDAQAGTDIDLATTGAGTQTIRIFDEEWSDTFATTDVDTTTDEITIASHELHTTEPVRVSSTDTLPAPLIAGTTYYAINVDANTIQLAASVADAESGTDIDLTTVGVGTHTIQAYNVDPDVIQLAASVADAQSGTEINLTSVGVGTHTIQTYDTYERTNGLLGFSGLQETADMQVTSAKVSLSGVDTAKALSMILQDDFLYREIRIYQVFFDANHQIIANPEPILKARMDAPSFVEDPDGGTSTATIEAASHYAQHGQSPGRQTNDEMQQFYFPGDRGFEFVSSTPKVTLWGRW